MDDSRLMNIRCRHDVPFQEQPNHRSTSAKGDMLPDSGHDRSAGDSNSSLPEVAQYALQHPSVNSELKHRTCPALLPIDDEQCARHRRCKQAGRARYTD